MGSLRLVDFQARIWADIQLVFIAFLTVTRYRRGTPLRGLKGLTMLYDVSLMAREFVERKKNLARGGSHAADHVPQQERWELLHMLGKDYVPPINSMPFSWSIVANLIGKTTASWSVHAIIRLS